MISVDVKHNVLPLCGDGTHTGACHRCRKCDDTDVVRQEGNDPQQNATGIAHVQRNGPCVTLANSLLAETTEKTASCLCHVLRLQVCHYGYARCEGSGVISTNTSWCLALCSSRVEGWSG